MARKRAHRNFEEGFYRMNNHSEKDEEEMLNTAVEIESGTVEFKKSKKKSDPNMKNLSVIAYRDFAKLTPNATQRKFIAETATDLSKWEEILKRWMLKGFSPRNVEGMLNVYSNGWLWENGQPVQASLGGVWK